MAFQPGIGHHRRHKRVVGQLAPGMGAFGDHAHQLVAIDQAAFLVDQVDPVGVAVQADPQVRPLRQNRVDAGLRRGRAAARVDVGAVRIGADADHLGAQFPDQLRPDAVRRAVGGIDDHAQPVQAQPARKGVLDELHVAFARPVDAPGMADQRRFRQIAGSAHGGLDGGLVRVRQLVAVGAEELDAVVVMGVVRGGDHHAQIGAQRPRQHAHGGRRQGAGQQDVHPRRGEARDKGAFDHIAGKPRVLADHHGPGLSPAGDMAPRRPAQLHDGLGRDGPDIRASPDAIGSK